MPEPPKAFSLMSTLQAGRQAGEFQAGVCPLSPENTYIDIKCTLVNIHQGVGAIALRHVYTLVK